VNRIDPSKALEPTQPASRPPAGKATTAKVFAVFASAWPNRGVTEPTLNLWAHQIGHLDESVALEAASTIVRTSEWWPTIRHFVEVANGVSVRRSRTQNVAALPEARDVDLAKQKISEMRRALGIAASKHPKEQP
jgi:hypothetical protein